MQLTEGRFFAKLHQTAKIVPRIVPKNLKHSNATFSNCSGVGGAA